jgi:hypothetical protein
VAGRSEMRPQPAESEAPVAATGLNHVRRGGRVHPLPVLPELRLSLASELAGDVGVWRKHVVPLSNERVS